MKRFLVAAALALTIHGLFFGFGPKLLTKTSPPKPRQLTFTFGPAPKSETGPGPELASPVPSPDRVVTAPERIEETPVVREAPPKETPKPPEKTVSPVKEAPKPRPKARSDVRPKKREATPPPKKPIPEKKKRIVAPPPAEEPRPKEKPAPEAIREPAAVSGATRDHPMDGKTGARMGPLPNAFGLSGAVAPEAGEKAASLPSTGITSKATPVYRKNPRPEYPRTARRRGYEGTVLLEVLVNSAGKVDELRLEESSGYDILDRSAMKSVRNWVFEPGSIGDRKVDMWVRVPVRFELKER
ncbi:MAG: energy transducer TonB [Candidatus Desulfacyla sp.]